MGQQERRQVIERERDLESVDRRLAAREVRAGVVEEQVDAAFAAAHGAERAFGDWRELLRWEGVDAVYVATPTGPREERAVAAARAGRHVLAEKPFASLPSLRRITASCRDSGVCFMDATHFVHHPRFRAVRERTPATVGTTRSLETRFLVSLTDRGDIRYDAALEPLGALGDLGWYNMRATVEYLAADAPLKSVRAALDRDPDTGAVTAAEGSLEFENGAASRWRCAFTAPAVDIGLRLAGPDGEISMDDFVGEAEDHSASFRCSQGRDGHALRNTVRIESALSGPALMFRHFAAAVANSELREPWIRASERTQALLDAVLEAAER
ncbi:MAG: Gfo/Idh/MocA family oxidoreductase [Deinococcales bacterium]